MGGEISFRDAHAVVGNSSMDHSRLQRKGLIGALIIMGGELECVDGPRLRSRHIHPWELSVLTGCPPNKKWPSSLKIGTMRFGDRWPHLSNRVGYMPNTSSQWENTLAFWIFPPQKKLCGHMWKQFSRNIMKLSQRFTKILGSAILLREHMSCFLMPTCNRVIPTGVADPSDFRFEAGTDRRAIPIMKHPSMRQPMKMAQSSPFAAFNPGTGDSDHGHCWGWLCIWGIRRYFWGRRSWTPFDCSNTYRTCQIPPESSEEGLSIGTLFLDSLTTRCTHQFFPHSQGLEVSLHFPRQSAQSTPTPHGAPVKFQLR